MKPIFIYNDEVNTFIDVKVMKFAKKHRLSIKKKEVEYAVETISSGEFVAMMMGPMLIVEKKLYIRSRKNNKITESHSFKAAI